MTLKAKEDKRTSLVTFKKVELLVSFYLQILAALSFCFIPR